MIFMQTDRLILRNLLPQDAEIIFDYRNHPICSRYQHGQTKAYDRIVSLVQQRANDRFDCTRPFMIAVALKQSDEMVGEIVVIPSDQTISLGYTFSYLHHRKGYAFEALTSLIARIHEEHPHAEFISFTDPENQPSISLLLKLGYQNLGYLPDKQSNVFGKWITQTTKEEICQKVQPI